jgi:hypothetical protein
MNNCKNKSYLSLNVAFILAALLIMVDFILPGKVVTDEIINVERELQQYHNAARNYHYSYKITTSEHEFSVTDDFAESITGNEKIEYSVSRIFEEVNWYRKVPSEKKAVYSLRIISGLVLPLLTIVSIAVAYRYKKNTGTFVFVLQTLLVANVVYLLL